MYRILMVDKYGQNYGEAGHIGNADKVRAKVCCNPNEYTISIRGTMPTGADRFMIVPASSATTGTNSLGMFTLPMGAMTNVLADSKSGAAAQIYKGSLAFKTDDAAGFVKSPEAKGIMAKAIVDSNADLSHDMVFIESLSVETRRLGGDDARRLAVGDVVCKYQILVQSTYTGAPFTQKTIDPTKLSTALVKHAKAAGMSTFKVTGTPTVATPTAETIGGTTVTGAASPMAGNAFSAMVMAIAARAGRQILA